jgi:hypothetical protein
MCSLRRGTLPALASAGLDELALELSQAAKNRQHQPSVRRGGIRPGIGQRLEASASLGDHVEDVQKVTRGSRQAVEVRHH